MSGFRGVTPTPPRHPAQCRELVDDAYERVGAYQDLDEVRTILKAPVTPDLVNVRQTRMNVALLGASFLAVIQASNPFIADVFDPIHEADFHDVRKGTRSVLLLMNMFPDTRGALPGAAEPLFALVARYGDVNHAFTAYRLAATIGVGQDAPAAFLRDELSKPQARQQVVVDAHSYDALIGRLNDIQRQHQRCHKRRPHPRSALPTVGEGTGGEGAPETQRPMA